MSAKVYPLAVYTADHGLAWSYPRGEISFAELDACRTAFGPLPDFDAGDKGFEGVWANGNKVFALRCQSVSAWDFRGRSATYLAVTWMGRAAAVSMDFERLLDAEALRTPLKNPPPFFEVDAQADSRQEPIARPEPILGDGFARAGGIIAGQSRDAVIVVKRPDGSRHASCTIRSLPFAPFAKQDDAAFEEAKSALPERPDLSSVVVVLSIALFLTAAAALAFGFRWWRTDKELAKAKHELRCLQLKEERGCSPGWRLMDFHFGNSLIHTF